MPSRIKHLENVRQLGCIICQIPDPTIHHVHGGSIVDEWGLTFIRNDYLTVPLHARYHLSPFNPEAMGVRSWELRFGKQADMIREVSMRLGYDVLELATRGEITLG